MNSNKHSFADALLIMGGLAFLLIFSLPRGSSPPQAPPTREVIVTKVSADASSHG